jgi:hypothetical protein
VDAGTQKVNSLQTQIQAKATVFRKWEAQAELLHAAGRKPRILPSLEPDFDLAALRSRLAIFDAAVLSCLSTLQGGLFDIVRNCPYEAVSDTVPVVLLP